MIALDLFAALMAADLPNRDCIVLAELLVHSYGPKKARSVHLDPATIEHYTGLHRNNARRAIGELEKAGIIARQEDGSYAFVKDYESWQPGGKPLADRLSGGVLRFAQSAVSRVGKRPDSKAKSAFVTIQPDCDTQANDAIQPDIASTPGPIQRDSLEAPHVNPTGLGPVGSCESSGIAPIVDATGEGGNRKRGRAPASEDLETLDPSSTPCPDEATSLWDIQPGKFRPSREEVERTWRLSLAEFPTRQHGNIAYEIWARQQWYPPEVWRAAIRQAKATKPGLNGKGAVNFVGSIAERIWQEGGVQPPAGVDPDNPPAPATVKGPSAPPRYESAMERRTRERKEAIARMKAERAAARGENT